MWQKIHHLFIPHRDTHKKAHLLSWEVLIVYILLFLLLQVSFSLIGSFKPGVLGISSNIQKEEVIHLTNTEREKLGLPTLVESQALNQAAEAKAANMFEENYWAHFSPSGKDPWGFILGSGYKFSFAGENLAKNFQESNTVVAAWMASPSHRDNIVNSRYKDIGIAVVDGLLNGQQTTLVVQMFGTTSSLAAAPKLNISGKEHLVPKDEFENPLPLVAATQQQSNLKPIINPNMISKSVGLGLVGFVLTLLLVDLIILKRRGVFRVTSHHIAHMAVLTVAAAALVSSQTGSIL